MRKKLLDITNRVIGPIAHRKMLVTNKGFGCKFAFKSFCNTQYKRNIGLFGDPFFV